MDVLQLVKSFGLKYVDLRDSKGVLCVNGGLELSSAMANLRNSGFPFAYATSGVWLYKSPCGTSLRKTAEPEQTQAVVAKKNTGSSPADDVVRAAIVSILNEHFPNGIRPNSIIDSNKLKKYYAEATGNDISNVVSDIPATLDAIGIRHGDKVYAVSTSGRQELSGLFERLLSEGNRLFYYDDLYDAHADFLCGIHIFSSELLRTVLSEINQSLWFRYKNYDLWFYKNYCLTDKNITVESEIMRCYETAVFLSYDQLKSRLPYIPIAVIRQTLAQNSSFIWVSTGLYTHVGKIEFDDAERRDACAKIEDAVSRCDFATLNSINVRASLELNPDLSESAIKSGFFQVYLADRFEKHGNIVTQKGKALRAVTLFELYCRAQNRLTLDDLVAVEVAINGSNHRQSLLAAYNNMVRIDRDTFVGDGEIHFDIDAADAALDLFVQGNIIPLRMVTSFTSFPYMDGYTWNLFLLESYCRRFSKRYTFQCLSVNSNNVGAIFKKSANFADYTEALAFAVAYAPLELNNKDVGDYLLENGYIARRRNVIVDVVARAQLLRERGV